MRKSDQERPIRVVRVEPEYWDLTPEERFEAVRQMLRAFSPKALARKCALCGTPVIEAHQVRGTSLCDRHWTLKNRLLAMVGLTIPTRQGSEDVAEEE